MRFLNLRILGIIGIIGAPWMLIDFIENGLYDRFVMTSESGIRNVIFMTGWICSVLGLYKIHQPILTKGHRTVFIIQLLFLILADIWSAWEIVNPVSSSQIFFLLNFTWPLGGCLMIATGVIVARANKMKGWQKYTALVAGFWFPQTLILYWLSLESLGLIVSSGIYAAVSFGLLGFSLVVSEESKTKRFVA